MKKKIFAISGSTRQHSTNQSILKYIADAIVNDADMEVYADIDKLPHFNPDADTESPPEIISALRRSITEADAVIISTPEYIYSLPGGLKNVIDWSVSTTIFKDKPVAIIVAAASGEKAFESLDLVMSTITVQKIPDQLKLHIPGVRSKISEQGLINDLSTVNQIKCLCKELLQTI